MNVFSRVLIAHHVSAISFFAPSVVFAKEQLRHLLTALSRPDWWILIVATATCAVIIWQVIEMRRATQVMRDTLISQKEAVNATISKERGRLRLVIQPASVVAGPQLVVCGLENYGPTPVFLIESRAIFIHVPDRNLTPDYARCKLVAYSETIQANTQLGKGSVIPMDPFEPLSEADVMSLRTEKSFLHFYGFADYRDVFDRKRRATIHVRWYMRWGGQLEGQIMQYWDPVGPQADNDDR
jgi:hypothetical protein